jgi:hypothetical protein
MNVQDNNGSAALAKVANGQLAVVEAVSCLVARGAVDVSRLGLHSSTLSARTSLWLEVSVPGIVWIRPKTGRLMIALAQTPANIELNPGALAEADEGLAKANEQQLIAHRKRYEKLRALNAPAIILENESQLISRYENALEFTREQHSLNDYAFHFEARRGWLASPEEADRSIRSLAQLKTLAELSLNGCHVTDQGLAHLRGHPELFCLSLNTCRAITEEGLAGIVTLPRLQELELAECQITDNGLRHLSSATGLEKLILAACPLTDNGLVHLRSLSKLRELAVSTVNRYYCSFGDVPCKVGHLTDHGLVHLSAHVQLEDLELVGCSLTDSGLAYLSRLNRLKHLDLTATGITGQGLAHLNPQAPLQHVYLKECPVTDQGLRQVAVFSELRELFAGNGTSFGDSGLAELRNVLVQPELDFSDWAVSE